MNPDSAIDYLSFCPSLSSILSFTDSIDIDRCRLVNRRLYEVIASNERSLPPRKENIIRIGCHDTALFWGHREYGSVKAEFLVVSLEGSSKSSFIITEKRIRMKKYEKGFLVDYYNTNAIPIDAEELLPDEAVVGSSPFCIKTNVFPFRPSGEPLNTLDFHVSSMAEGLSTLLSLFFQKCPRGGKLYMENGAGPVIPSIECLTSIADQFEKNRSKCQYLKANALWPGLKWLCKKLECGRLVLSLTEYVVDIVSVLDDLVCSTEVEISVQTHPMLEHMVQLAQKWSADDGFRVKRQSLSSESRHRDPSLLSNLGFITSISNGLLIESEHDHPDRVSVIVARPSDKTRLSIAYNKSEHRIDVCGIGS